MKDFLATTNYIFVTANEVTTIDNQSWLCYHAYFVQKWTRVPIFPGLVQIVDGCGVNNLTTIILEAIMKKGGLSKAYIGEKLIYFVEDGHPSS